MALHIRFEKEAEREVQSAKELFLLSSSSLLGLPSCLPPSPFRNVMHTKPQEFLGGMGGGGRSALKDIVAVYFP